MIALSEHPTVRRVRARAAATEVKARPPLDAGWLRRLCLDAGADDAGFVEINRPELADQRSELTAAFPPTKSLISFVCRMNREDIRSPARSVANLEFGHVDDRVNETARTIVATLESYGVRALNPSMGFPMEVQRFPDGKTWVVSHKPVAVAAGLGHIGIHRNVIHPRFGNFILLGTILIDADVSRYDRPIEYNPCLECKLCVSACPVGAIGSDGRFDFSACYAHNYREFLGGFSDWVENVVESRNRFDYRKRVTDGESASMWQSLSFGANYKAAYCMAVCPAGEDVIGPFLQNRKEYLQDVVRPLQDKAETLYVIPNSDAEDHVTRRFPHKKTKRVGRSLRPHTVPAFFRGLSLTFQRNHSKGVNAVYHFTFTGEEAGEGTVAIRNGRVEVNGGHTGTPDIRIFADGRTWLGFLAGERSLVWSMLRRKIRIKGSPRLLLDFGRCFPK